MNEQSDNEVLSDPFHAETDGALPETSPGSAEEKPAPDTIPAPADEHPNPQPQYVPSARRAEQE